MTPLLPLPTDVDVLVVGAGVVGLAHALRALDEGLRVLVIDRDHAPHGASVRNFGHVGSTLQAGDLGVLTRDSRETWLKVAARTGVPVHEVGTVVLAATDVEHAVLEELADADPDEVALMTPRQVEAATTVPGHGGAFFGKDLRVDPRTTAPRIAAWLAEQPRVEVAWATSYLGHVDDRRIRTSRGEVRASRTIICVGHDVDQLQPELAADREVLRCRLQMARVDGGVARIGPALFTATSMLRYSAFAQAPSYDALAAATRERLRDLVSIDANLMITQLPDGSLVVGDSHESSPGASPFLDERTEDILLHAAAELFGRPLRVLERWQGVYATSPQGPLLVHDLTPTTTVVTVTTGLGMTLCHGLAARTRL